MAKPLSKTALDWRSRQLNPADPLYWQSRGYELTDADVLARAEQLRDNPPEPVAGDKPKGTSNPSTKNSAKPE